MWAPPRRCIRSLDTAHCMRAVYAVAAQDLHARGLNLSQPCSSLSFPSPSSSSSPPSSSAPSPAVLASATCFTFEHFVFCFSIVSKQPRPRSLFQLSILPTLTDLASPHLGLAGLAPALSQAMPRGKAGGRGMSIGDRLRELELRIESLDVAVREIHPDYVPGIIARTTELEKLCREHVNSTCRVLENQRLGVKTVVKEAEARAESAVASLMKAANRHHEEAHNLRAELVPFKEMVDRQSQESE